jgi:Flp pilus assembly protein TadG
MMRVYKFLGDLARFGRNRSGATAVEFAILLPVMLVTFGAIVEGSRIYWNYQAAVSGVRDASRYLARITNNDVCGGAASTNTNLAGGAATATTIINRNIGTGGSNLFPVAVSLSTTTPVSATYNCIAVTGVGVVPVAVVNATVQVQLPFAALFSFFGPVNGQMTSTITDQSRIYGI